MREEDKELEEYIKYLLQWNKDEGDKIRYALLIRVGAKWQRDKDKRDDVRNIYTT
jgi:hypothetical protein